MGWIRYFQEEMNHPSRADYYSMRIAERIVQTNSKNPRNVSLEDQKVEFIFEGEKKKTLTLEEADAISKSNWRTRLGVTKPRITKREEIEDKSYTLGENQ